MTIVLIVLAVVMLLWLFFVVSLFRYVVKKRDEAVKEFKNKVERRHRIKL